MPTSEWTIEAPTNLEFDEVIGLRVRLIAGSVAVLATTGKPSLEVSSVEGDPLSVTYEDGVLTVAHENLNWEGLLKWLRPQRHAATVTVSVPRKCQAQVGVVSVGSAGAERQIVNVAAGAISATSTDAVNGSQLFSIANQVSTLKTDLAALTNTVGKISSSVPSGTVADSTGTAIGKNTSVSATNGTALGNGANVSGDNGTGIGVNATVTAANGTATGTNSTVTATNGTATGTNSTVTATNGTATGANSTVTATNGTATGANSKVTAANGTAIGTGSNVSGNNSTAIGANSQAPANNAVALGANSVASRDNTVSIGAPGAERQLTNMADGTAPTDGVNVRQLNGAINSVREEMSKYRKDSDAGTASAIAMANMPQAVLPGEKVVALGGGTYGGQSAMAVGLSVATTKWLVKGSVTTAVSGHGSIGAGAGVGYRW